MDGFKKGGKFIPTDIQKKKGVSSDVIKTSKKNQEIGVSRTNFNKNSNQILEQKLAHLNDRS